MKRKKVMPPVHLFIALVATAALDFVAPPTANTRNADAGGSSADVSQPLAPAFAKRIRPGHLRTDTVSPKRRLRGSDEALAGAVT